MPTKKRKIILVIRDGWGYRKEQDGNALTKEFAPVNSRLMEEYPHTLLDASGEAVGLPAGYQGNSEVGHMTIGSGRIIFQSLERINKSIKDGDFFKIPEFLAAIENCKENKTSLHIMGLIQTEGVHAHIDHLFALLDLCKMQDFMNVYIHAFTDGRDAPVNHSIENIRVIEKKIEELGFGKIATISGRYYAMDRDKRWDRTKMAYDCIVNGIGNEFQDAEKKMEGCYSQNETDEFIKPSKLEGYAGVKSKDSIIFFNFRTDRVRQLAEAIVEDEFDGWERKPLDVYFVLMVQTAVKNAKIAFKTESLKNLLGEIVAKNGLKQLRISETEKYPHVTFFFNGQIENPYPGEDRILVASPKVATYDLQPEMSIYELTNKIVEEIKTEKYDFIVINLVNCDMVGHTGLMDAIHEAVKAVDSCTGKIIDESIINGYTVLICADHGNAEDKTALNNTSHTKNRVPFILVSNDEELNGCQLRDGAGLSDIAPTILDLFGIKKPDEMTGSSLIKQNLH